jgi:hypothetical protein
MWPYFHAYTFTETKLAQEIWFQNQIFSKFDWYIGLHHYPKFTKSSIFFAPMPLQAEYLGCVCLLMHMRWQQASYQSACSSLSVTFLPRTHLPHTISHLHTYSSVLLFENELHCSPDRFLILPAVALSDRIRRHTRLSSLQTTGRVINPWLHSVWLTEWPVSINGGVAWSNTIHVLASLFLLIICYVPLSMHGSLGSWINPDRVVK